MTRVAGVRTFRPFALVIALAFASTVAAACSSDDEAATPKPSPTASVSQPTGTPDATGTSVPATPTPSNGSPTATPTVNIPTSTPLPVNWTILEKLECVETHPGVPNPDGPNMWIDVEARITNPGDEPIQIGSITPFTVKFYDADGQLLTTTKGPIPVDQFEPGQTHTMNLKHEEPALPSAAACRISVTGADNELLPMGGVSEASISVLALP